MERSREKKDKGRRSELSFLNLIFEKLKAEAADNNNNIPKKTNNIREGEQEGKRKDGVKEVTDI